ncbi:MAG: PHP domain-containing protein [Thermoguttaceae bacterium]
MWFGCGGLGSLVISAGLASLAAGAQGATGQTAWYKGNTHCHSFWSDGDEFPEMVADWYKSHGYHFLGLSDHNVLMHGEKWRDVHQKDRPIPQAVIDKCRQRFGDGWVQTRGQGKQLQVRLKTLDEIRARLEEPGRFLMIESEEITGKCGKIEVHLNAVNLAELIEPQERDTVVETLRADLQAVQEQARRLGRPILAHVNHPNWRWFDISADDLAEAVEARFFEVCNASPGVNRLGAGKLPSTDRLWDIANTLRIARWKAPPLYGVASDDAHAYQQFVPEKGNPGRGWVMVRAKQLTAEAILEAMQRGEFYASTGVTLRQVRYDPERGTYSVQVDPQPGAHYTIQFLGTLASYDPATHEIPVIDKEKRPRTPVRGYSPDIGKVLRTVRGTRATYRLTGQELYVRAVVRSDQKMPNPPSGQGEYQEAWCQPVGWEKWLK